MVVTWQTEPFQLVCQHHLYDRSTTYEEWCNGFGISEPTVLQADLHFLDPAIKEVYFPYNSPLQIRWKEGIHQNQFQGWKVKSQRFKLNHKLASTIKHLKLYGCIMNKNLDAIISLLERLRRYDSTYIFKMSEYDGEFDTLILTLHRKLQVGDASQQSTLLEHLVEVSPTTFLCLWTKSNNSRDIIQNYMYS
jgi:hypothetical protein